MSLFRRWQLSHFGEREGMRFEKEDFGVQAMLETWDHWDPSGWFQWKISSSIHVRQEKHISLKTSFKNSWRSHLFFNGGQFVVGSCGPSQGESVDIWPVHLLGDVFSTRNRCSSVAMSIPKPSSCFTKDSCRRSSRGQTQLGGSRTFRGRYTSGRVGWTTLTRILFFLIFGGIQYSVATMLPCSCVGIELRSSNVFGCPETPIPSCGHCLHFSSFLHVSLFYIFLFFAILRNPFKELLDFMCYDHLWVLAMFSHFQFVKVTIPNVWGLPTDHTRYDS